MSGERGLFLLVNPLGSKLWRLKYRFEGKEKWLALGAYPEVPLKAARAKCDEARQLIRDGRDPSGERKTARQRQKLATSNSFEAIAREFIEKRGSGWVEKYRFNQLQRLQNHILPGQRLREARMQRLGALVLASGGFRFG